MALKVSPRAFAFTGLCLFSVLLVLTLFHRLDHKEHVQQQPSQQHHAPSKFRALVRTPYEELSDWQNIGNVKRRPISILFIAERSWYLSIMDRQFFFIYEACFDHPLVSECTLWGNGWDGWDNKKSLADNIKHKFSGRVFDLIVQNGVQQLYDEDFVSNSNSNSGTVVGTMYGDCWNGSCLVNRRYAPSIVWNPYAQYVSWLKDIAHTRLISHVPFCADRNIFATEFVPYKKRKVPILIVGSVFKGFYPLRSRIHDLITAGKLPGKIRPHPGYLELKSPQELKAKFGIDLLSKEPYKFMREDYGYLVNQYREYAKEIQNAKLVMFDPSVFRIPVKKFHETMMSGSVILGALPNEFEEVFSRGVLRISDSMTDEEIIDTVVNKWLKDDEKLQKMALEAQQISLELFNCENAVTRIVNSYWNFKEGKRGVEYASTWSDTCYGIDDKFAFNDYCTKPPLS